MSESKTPRPVSSTDAPRLESRARLSITRWDWILLVVLVAHVPGLFSYFGELWGRTHYQFFPVALAAFGWLVWTRSAGDTGRRYWPALGLLIIDLLLLAYGTLIDTSPWTIAAGLCVVAAAYTIRKADVSGDRSLLYLTLLPLMTLRLPVHQDNQVITWLQRVTTSAASDTLYWLKVVHARSGVQLEFPEKSFEVAEACSGVQSLFTVLFLATVVICMRRRPLLHSVPLLLCGFVLAGLMNMVRVLTITLVWQRWGRDLSTGVLHDILGYTCLAAAALLLMSADGVFELLLPSVPDVKRPGPVGVFRNPLVAVWNWIASFNFSRLTGFRSATTAAEQATGNPPAEARSDARLAALNDGLVQHRRWPTGRQWLSPVNWWHFFLGFMESWLYSRPLNAISVALPFVLVGMGCVAMQIWISSTPLEPVITFLESQFDNAQRVSDVPRQEICLTALSELRPQDSRYQFRLALFQIENGREQRGVDGIIRLANRPTADSVEARKWLIHQARTEKPVRPLTDEQVEGQLRWVVSNFPRDYEAHEMLARQYIKRQEWHLAEAHLTEAAEARPELNLPLIRLKQDLRRDSANIADRVQLALDALTSRLTEQPASHTIRVALARTLILAGRDAEARELLVSGIKSFPDSSLNKELCELELLFAARRLKESPLNRDTCLAMTLAALQSDPGNVAGMQMLMQLHALGARLTTEPLKDTRTFWSKKLEQNASDDEARLMLAQLYKLTEEHDAAISHLRPLVAERPDLERELAGLLLKVNRNDPEALTLLTNVIDRSRATLQSTPADVPAAIAMCDSLLLLNRPDEVRSALQAFAVTAEDGTVTPLPADPALAQFFGRATLAVYDRLTGLEEPWTDPDRPAPEPGDTGADPKTLLSLLTDALRAPASVGPAIDRLAQLSLSDHPAADEAANAARQLRLDGNVSASVLNLMGMHALMKQRYDIAREFLDHARTTSGDNDAMILNNLALAIVRGNPDAAGLDAALRHANRAVELLKDHPDALSTRAEIFIHMERWPDAEADLIRSIASQRDTAENHRLLALAFEGQNDVSMATLHRQRADALEAASPPDAR